MAISLRGMLTGLRPGQLSGEGPYGGATTLGLPNEPLGVLVSESEQELVWETADGSLIVDDSAFYIGGQGSSNLEAVATCVRVITDTIRAIPIFTVRSESGDRVETVLDDLLKDPNPFTRWGTLSDQLVTDYLLYGDAYLFVERTGRVPRALWHIPAGRVTNRFNRTAGAVVFETQGAKLANVAGELPMVAHFLRQPRGEFPPRGTSVIRSLRQVVGHGMAADQYAQNTALNGRQAYALKAPKVLSDSQRAAIGKGWKEATHGAKNFNRTPVLEDGVEPVPLSMSMVDMDALSHMKLDRLRIGAAFGVPPLRLNDLDKASYANAAQQERHFVKNAVLPVLNELLDVLHRAVLNGEPGYRLEYDLDPVMRADPMELTKIKAIEVKTGIRTAKQAAADLGYPDDEFEEPETPADAADGGGGAPDDPPADGGQSPADADPK